jgi:hypothetical protein
MPEEAQEILGALEIPGQLETPVKKFKLTEIRAVINHLRPKKDMTLLREESLRTAKRRNKSYHPNI